MRFSLRTQYSGHKNIKIILYWIAGGVLISGVVYKFAGDNNWSAMSSTNPRCRLKIHGVIYQSADINYWSPEKKLNAQNIFPKKNGPTPKKYRNTWTEYIMTISTNHIINWFIMAIKWKEIAWHCLLAFELLKRSGFNSNPSCEL